MSESDDTAQGGEGVREGVPRVETGMARGTENAIPGIGLPELIAPLSVGRFLDEHWHRDKPYLAVEAAVAAATLRSLPKLSTVQALIEASPGDVALFGPNGFRSSVPSRSAAAFHARGDTLYITGLERTVDPDEGLRSTLAADLGVPTSAIFLEGFAARPGAVSSRHYDFDVNFQVLLEGRKTWRFATNTNVTKPLASLVPGQQWRDEVIARDRALTADFTDDATILTASAGSVVFLPRGMWHETVAEDDCLGVNFAIRPPMWFEALARLVAGRLVHDERFRDYTFGASAGSLLHSAAERQLPQLLPLLKENLADITLADIAGSRDRRTWKVATAWRRLPGDANPVSRPALELPPDLCALPDDLARVLQAILVLQAPFEWSDARALAPDVSAERVTGLLELMASGNLLEPTGHARR